MYMSNCNCGTQMILIRTDRHDVESKPVEQWIGVQMAGALMLLQSMPESNPVAHMRNPLNKNVVMTNNKWKALDEALWTLLTVHGFSKWDFRSKWYIKEVQPPG